MDLNRILNELKQEHELVQDTIVSLERPARGAGKRRRRPPAWLTEATPHRNRKRPAENKPQRPPSARRSQK